MPFSWRAVLAAVAVLAAFSVLATDGLTRGWIKNANQLQNLAPKQPSPREIAEKCGEKREAGGKSYTQATYEAALKQLIADIEKSSGDELRLNQDAATTIENCRLTQNPRARRMYVSCGMLLVTFRQDTEFFNSDPKTARLPADKKEAAYKSQVLDPLREPAKLCMSRMRCRAGNEAEQAELANTYDMFATMVNFGSLTSADLTTGQQSVRMYNGTRKKVNIGRRFCGVTFEDANKACLSGKYACATGQEVANMLTDMEGKVDGFQRGGSRDRGALGGGGG